MDVDGARDGPARRCRRRRRPFVLVSLASPRALGMGYAKLALLVLAGSYASAGRALALGLVLAAKISSGSSPNAPRAPSTTSCSGSDNELHR
jgi:hypothetical protein